MTRSMTTLKFILPAAALTMSAFGLSAGSTGAANTNASDLPLSCEIAVSKSRYGHTYEGVIHAEQTVRGTYALSIAQRGGGNSSMISQSGDFTVAAGKSDTIGQATFGGMPPSQVNAELTVNWNGKTLFCTNQTDL